MILVGVVLGVVLAYTALIASMWWYGHRNDYERHL